jgi:hypothetical protein
MHYLTFNTPQPGDVVTSVAVLNPTLVDVGCPFVLRAYTLVWRLIDPLCHYGDAPVIPFSKCAKNVFMFQKNGT